LRDAGRRDDEVSSSLTGLLIAAVPLVAAVIATATGAERLRLTGGVGLALGVVGVAAIVGVNLEGAHTIPLAEIGLVAVCYAVGPAILQRWLT
jgi:drug/metabolite transporter (DMT)-like permease